MEEILCLINTLDEKHYQGMMNLIQPVDEWSDSPGVSEDFMPSREQPADQKPVNLLIVGYLPDTNIAIYASKSCPAYFLRRFLLNERMESDKET